MMTLEQQEDVDIPPCLRFEVGGLLRSFSGKLSADGFLVEQTLLVTDYTGKEWDQALAGRTDLEHVIQVGDRIAQMVFVPVLRPQLQVVTEFESSARGSGGFGHTGLG